MGWPKWSPHSGNSGAILAALAGHYGRSILVILAILVPHSSHSGDLALYERNLTCFAPCVEDCARPAALLARNLL